MIKGPSIPMPKFYGSHFGKQKDRSDATCACCKFFIKKNPATNPLFQWYPESNEILLNLSMKRWNSAFNAQGLIVIVVVVHDMSSENICSCSGGAQEKWKTGWNSVYHKKWWWFSEYQKTPLPTRWLYSFAGYFNISRPLYDQTQGCRVVFFLLCR